jgi:hypothetical protein
LPITRHLYELFQKARRVVLLAQQAQAAQVTTTITFGPKR